MFYGSVDKLYQEYTYGPDDSTVKQNRSSQISSFRSKQLREKSPFSKRSKKQHEKSPFSRQIIVDETTPSPSNSRGFNLPNVARTIEIASPSRAECV